MYFVRGGGELHEGEEICPPGERKYFLPPVTFVTGETLFCDTGLQTAAVLPIYRGLFNSGTRKRPV